MSVWTKESFALVHQHFHGQDAPAFESPEMQARVWGRRWGVTNAIGTLRMMLMHRPGDELKVVDERRRHPAVPALARPRLH